MAARKVSDADKVEMQQLRNDGMSLNALAERFGVSGATVQYHTISPPPKPGEKRRGTKPGVFTSATDETMEMWRLYASGEMTQAQIAKRFGCTQHNVSVRLKRFSRTMPEDTREMLLRRDLEQLDRLRKTLFDIVDGGIVATSDRIAAARAILATMERLSKMLGLDASDLRDERRVILAEKQGEMIAQAMTMFAQLMGFDPNLPQVRKAMVTALEGVQVESEDAA